MPIIHDGMFRDRLLSPTLTSFLKSIPQRNPMTIHSQNDPFTYTIKSEIFLVATRRDETSIDRFTNRNFRHFQSNFPFYLSSFLQATWTTTVT